MCFSLLRELTRTISSHLTDLSDDVTGFVWYAESFYLKVQKYGQSKEFKLLNVLGL